MPFDPWSERGSYSQQGTIYKGTTQENTPIATSSPTMMPQDMRPSKIVVPASAITRITPREAIMSPPSSARGAAVVDQAANDAWKQYQIQEQMRETQARAAAQPQAVPATMREMMWSDIKNAPQAFAAGARRLFGGTMAEGYTPPSDIRYR